MTKSGRLQSAMEYLMTYGWAVLAIAIVMVSLYSLGIFNSGSLQPTANPGSCEVVRTVAQTSLAGQCSSMIPKYVGRLSSLSGSEVSIGSGVTVSNFTESAWVEFLPPTPAYYGIFGGLLGPGNYYSPVMQSYYNTGPYSVWVGFGTGSAQCSFQTGSFTTGWHHIVSTYNGSRLALYIDGSAIASTSCSPPYPTPITQIGYGGWNSHFAGEIANAQIYNTSLDSGTVKALYKEGIGGTPIDLRHLIGWWPLNGNANDYSGNNNQGTATNIKWDANWQMNYTAPKS